MNFYYNKVSAIALSASIGFGGIFSAVSASDAKAQDADLAEIVVTAKNRRERLQDVPLAITTFSGDALRQSTVRDIRDLQKLTPSLSVFSGNGRTDGSALAMRGIAPNTSDERFQGIAFFVDGVALSGQILSLDPSQIERVEVMKGPQSASFGRATYTGAINYITRDPGGDAISGNVTTRWGGNEGAKQNNSFLSGYVNGPLIKDHLWASLEGSMMQQGAVVASRDTGARYGRETTQAVAGSLFWAPNDKLTVKARTSYSHDRDSQSLSVLLHGRDFVEAGTPTVSLSRAGGALWPTVVPSANIDLVSYTEASDAWLKNGGSSRDRYFTSLVASYDLGDYELSYRGGYFHDDRVASSSAYSRSAVTDEVFAAPYAGGRVTLNAAVTAAGSRLVSRERFTNTSHQLLLLSPTERRLRWKIGAYYFQEDDKNNFSSFRTAANPSGQIRGLETVENKAVFGSLDFDIKPSLTLAMEGRYQWESLGQDKCLTCGQVTSVDATFEEQNFLPRVTLSYKVTPRSMLYGLYSYGVKSGRLSRVDAATQYYARPEKLDNFEVGSKNSFLSGALILNLAAFYEKLTDQQLVSTVDFVTPAGGLISLSTTNNAGASTVKGFEIESNWRATRNLTFSGGVGYAKQEFTSKTPLILSSATAIVFSGVSGQAVVLDGKTQANVPATNGFVAAEYVQPDVWNGMSAGVRLDANYRGSYFVDLANIAKVKDAWTFNGRVRLYSDDIELALFGRNLADNKRPLGVGLAGGTSGCVFTETDKATYGAQQVCMAVSMPRPREWGVELTKRF